MVNAEHILEFWFEELAPRDWFRKSDQLDNTIRRRFAETHLQAAAGECFTWRQSARGRLAEVIVLDQFSRNLFRNDPRAFAQDAQALALAQEAIAQGHDQALTTIQRAFLYMPYMHSESAVIHDQALNLFAQPGLEDNLRFEQRHKAIIDRFGRYPHRNEALGRSSTEEELDFLQQPGSGF